MPLLETGTNEGRAEAAGTLRCLASSSEEIKVQMIRSGVFGPLVRLLNSGTMRAKEESAGALYELLILMNECKISVNVTPDAAEDIRFLLKNGSPTGQGQITRDYSDQPILSNVHVGPDSFFPKCMLFPTLILNARFFQRVLCSWTRGLHSSTFELNVSAFCGIGGAFRGCLGAV